MTSILLIMRNESSTKTVLYPRGLDEYLYTKWALLVVRLTM